MPPIPSEAAKAVIYNGEGHILLLQRNAATRDQDNWDLPGGLIEPDETPEQTLLREIREELGLEATIDAPLATWKFLRPKDGIWVAVQNFRCTLAQGQIHLSDEHIAYTWLRPAEYGSYPVKDPSFWTALRGRP